MIGSTQILVSSCKSYVVSLSSMLNTNNSLEITSNNHLPLFLIELDNQRREMELDQHKKMTTLRNDLEKELRKHAKSQAAVSENLQKKLAILGGLKGWNQCFLESFSKRRSSEGAYVVTNFFKIRLFSGAGRGIIFYQLNRLI